MKKTTSITIWVIALCAVLLAAYTFYSKNKDAMTIPPIQQGGSTQGSASGQDSAGGGSQAPMFSDETAAEEVTDEDKIMAPDFTLNAMDGKAVKLSDYRGKIVILNFWGVWCKYCILEMPDLNELHSELEKGDEAVILAVDVQESLDTVKKYVTSNNIDLKVLMDTEGTVAQTYGITGYPTTFIVKPDGSLYTYISGATDKETLQEILDKVKKGEPVR